MKCFTPEIAWHNRDPVLSIDIHTDPVSKSVYRLASGGSDTLIVIWLINCDADLQSKGVSKIEAKAELTRHQKAVNVVRFSPSGEFLASGDDESVILIWKKKNVADNGDAVESNALESDEQWTCHKSLRLHLDDVYDISWSPDSTHIISGSVDNTAILWNVNTGTKVAMFAEHRGFVQGVAWDPLEKYVATLGSDRTLRVYSVTNKNLVSQCSKAVLPRSKETINPIGRIFYDDTLKTYFRRLCFSPDGFLLFAPSGVIEPLPIPTSNASNSVEIPVKPISATYVFLRDSYNEPVMFYPTGDQYSVAVRCCPVLFKKKNTNAGAKAMFDLPYRIVIAVATKSSVILHDTEHATPFAYVTDIHYTRLTDLSWSSDGLLLVASSTDGFCTLISFAEGELGEPWQDEKEKNGDTTTTDENGMEINPEV